MSLRRIKNISRRPVSLHLNSGDTVYLPPNLELTLNNVEIHDNSMFDKLINNKLLAVGDPTRAADDQPADDVPADDEPNKRGKRRVVTTTGN